MSLDQGVIEEGLYSTNYLASEQVKAKTIIKLIGRDYLLFKDDTSVFKTIKPSYGGREGRRVVALLGDLPNIPTFNHPIYHNGVSYIDARAFINRQSGEIRNQGEYDNLIRRAILDMLWIEERDIFFSGQILNLTAKVFSEWVGTGVERGANLDMRTTGNVKVLLMAYILFQAVTKNGMGAEERSAFIIKKARDILGLQMEYVLTLTETYPTAFSDIYENPGRIFFLVKSLAVVTNDERLSFERTLYDIIGNGATMQSNSRELACISIENIPTFVALMHFVNFPSMKTTKIGSPLFHSRTKYGDVLERFISLNTSYETIDAR